MDSEVIYCVNVCLCAHKVLCECMCVYIWTYMRCEDPMAYFTRANLSNERSEKGIGIVLVGGSTEREGGTGSKL